MTSQRQPRRHDTTVNLAKSDSDVVQLLRRLRRTDSYCNEVKKNLNGKK